MHVTARHLNLGLMLAAIFSLVALMQTAAPARAQTVIGTMWQVPIDKAWEYGIEWHWNPSTNGIDGYMRPQIIVESVTGGVIEGRIATPSGDTLPMYGKDSRILASYGYDSGTESPQFSAMPEKGEFSIEIPEDYVDADYVELWVNGHSFQIKPSGTYPESETSTVTVGPTNSTSTSTFITEDGLEGTIEALVTEESATTTQINAGDESVVTVTTTKSFVTETTTITTPKSTDQIDTAAEEMTNASSTMSNSSSTTSTSVDERVTTVTDVMSSVSSETELTSTDKSKIEVTTVKTNSTTVTTETVSLAFEADLVTIWDNHRDFKIDGYYVFDGAFKEHTFHQGWLNVVVSPGTTQYRLGQ